MSAGSIPMFPASRSTSSLARSEEHTSELQSQSNLVCRLLLEKTNSVHHEFDGAQEEGVVFAAGLGGGAFGVPAATNYGARVGHVVRLQDLPAVHSQDHFFDAE